MTADSFPPDPQSRAPQSGDSSPVAFKRNRLYLLDAVPASQAAPLRDLLQAHPTARLDLSLCTHLHTAILQLLMAARPPVAAWPKDQDLRSWLRSALTPQP